MRIPTPTAPANTRLTTFWIAVLAGLAFAGTDRLIAVSGLHCNGSDSVPLGLYRETQSTARTYAAFCLSPSVLNDAKRTGLTLRSGVCPGGVAPILKPLVSASSQHPIVFHESGFLVDGISLPHTAPKAFSSSGKPLTHIPFGTYTAGLWAISTFNPDSFDSRYFGPVDPAAIRFYATPVFTY